MQIASIGIDLGKTVFHLIALAERNKIGIGVCVGTDTFHRAAFVRNRSQRSGHRCFRRHALRSDVIGNMLPSRTSSDAPEPR